MRRTSGLTKSVFMILGMRGNACRERVAAALELVPGVKDVDVNLHRARAAIVHQPTCTITDLAQAVVRQGYGVSVAERGPDRSTIGPAKRGTAPELLTTNIERNCP
jgi:copper chaperone CopZ